MGDCEDLKIFFIFENMKNTIAINNELHNIAKMAPAICALEIQKVVRILKMKNAR